MENFSKSIITKVHIKLAKMSLVISLQEMHDIKICKAHGAFDGPHITLYWGIVRCQPDAACKLKSIVKLQDAGSLLDIISIKTEPTILLIDINSDCESEHYETMREIESKTILTKGLFNVFAVCYPSQDIWSLAQRADPFYAYPIHLIDGTHTLSDGDTTKYISNKQFRKHIQERHDAYLDDNYNLGCLTLMYNKYDP